MATYTNHAGLDKAQGGQKGWGTVINRMTDKLDAMSAIGGFAVRPASIDPGTGQATGLQVTVAPGYVVSYDGRPLLRTFSGTPPTMPASSVTYVYIDGAFDLGYGVTSLPTTEGYLPLARVTTDASRITLIEDLRFAQPILAGSPYMWRIEVVEDASDVPIASNVLETAYSIDAATGNRTVTLPPLDAIGETGQVVIVHKGDASANTVTVQPVGGDLGPTVVLANQDEAVFLAPNFHGTRWFKFKFV